MKNIKFLFVAVFAILSNLAIAQTNTIAQQDSIYDLNARVENGRLIASFYSEASLQENLSVIIESFDLNNIPKASYYSGFDQAGNSKTKDPGLYKIEQVQSGKIKVIIDIPLHNQCKTPPLNFKFILRNALWISNGLVFRWQ